MADTWTKAFGLYLRTLRNRRKLSLEEVCSLSQTFADTLNKGYLSRCENGHQRVAFSKVIPLSRIYEVPADVLLERMELDMELDRVGSPDTEGMTFSELTKAGADALNQGFRWKGYAYLRDAVKRGAIDPKSERFTTIDEQVACTQMNCATAAAGLGRLLFTLHEYKYVESTNVVGPPIRPILLERLSVAYRNLEQHDLGRAYAEKAVTAAETGADLETLGYTYANRAHQALEESEQELASVYFQKAHRTFRDCHRPEESARALCNLSQVYFDLGRYRAARRALLATEKVIQPLKQHRTRALVRILLGEIEATESNEELAEQRWKEAVTIARELNDKVLRFKAEFLLFKQARRRGNEPVARAIRRRLSRLANWIPKNTPELRDFEGSTGHNGQTSNLVS